MEKPTDWLDAAAALTEQERDAGIAAARKAASEIERGRAGECSLCGEHSLRLVRKACARCRDKFKLP